MLDNANLWLHEDNSTAAAPLILDQKLVKRCHIYVPDMPKPVGAIFYKGQFYSFVKAFPAAEPAKRAAGRLIIRGNTVILTQVAKGFVLWVYEPEAKWVGRRA